MFLGIVQSSTAGFYRCLRQLVIEPGCAEEGPAAGGVVVGVEKDDVR